MSEPPNYAVSHHAQAVLGAMQEGLGEYVARQMKEAFRHGCERGRDDAKAEHRKEMKEAIEAKEREIRAELAGKQIDGLPALRDQIGAAILKVRDEVFDNEDVCGYEAVDDVMHAVMALLEA